MNRRRLLGVLGLGVAAKLSDNRPDEPAQTATLAVRIVPTSYREKTGRAIELRRPSEHFYVVVTNVSGEPIRLWKEWCSWGYFNLSDSTGLQVLRCRVSSRRLLRHPFSYQRRGCEDGRATEHPASQS
jgi:hypothetical protein